MGAVYLVRHGQASFGASDYDQLSELGMRQAAMVGAALRERGARFGRVLSGTLRRQVHTAQLASAELAAAVAGPAFDTDERWNEYDHLGVVAEHGGTANASGSSREFQRLLESSLRAWMSADGANGAHGAGESWADFRGRVEGALRELSGDLGRGEQALVFTSGGVIAAACAALLGGQAETFLALNRVTANTGITKLVSGRSGLSLVSFNEHTHLEYTPELVTYR